MAITKVTNSVVGSGSATDGYVLTADGSGNSAWEAVAGGPTFKTFGTEGSIMVGSSSTGTINAANYNTGLGTTVFAALTTGDGNTGVGFNSLTALTTGLSNTAIGNNTLQTLTTASYNTAVGQSALLANTTGTENTAVGNNSLDANTIGSYNTACGKNALTSNTVGNFCSAFGQASLETNTTGENITAVGHGSLRNNTTGSYNTAVGVNALVNNTTGTNNTAVGKGAGDSITTGGFNTAVGFEAGGNITTGRYNVCIGDNSGYTLNTGEFNVYMGYLAQASGSNAIDEIVIAAGNNFIVGKGNNTGFISPDGGGVYQGNNSSTWSQVSDRRIKKNIENNNIGLDAINQIQVKNFEYRTEDEIVDFDNPSSAVVKKEGIQLGVIAQEIEEILPDMVVTESTGVKSVNPDNLTWYLVNAVKELSAQVEELKAQIGV